MIEQRRSAAAAQQRVVGDFVGRAAIGGDWKRRVGDALPCTRTRLDVNSPMAKRTSPASLSMRLSSTSAAVLPISKTPSWAAENAIAGNGSADGTQTALGAQTCNQNADGRRRADFFRQERTLFPSTRAFAPLTEIPP